MICGVLARRMKALVYPGVAGKKVCESETKALALSVPNPRAHNACKLVDKPTPLKLPMPIPSKTATKIKVRRHL